MGGRGGKARKSLPEGEKKLSVLKSSQNSPPLKGRMGVPRRPESSGGGTTSEKIRVPLRTLEGGKKPEKGDTIKSNQSNAFTWTMKKRQLTNSTRIGRKRKGVRFTGVRGSISRGAYL